MLREPFAVEAKQRRFSGWGRTSSQETTTGVCIFACEAQQSRPQSPEDNAPGDTYAGKNKLLHLSLDYQSSLLFPWFLLLVQASQPTSEPTNLLCVLGGTRLTSLYHW